MKKGALKTVAIIAGAVAVIGLLSYIGGIRSVNAGAFVFPALIAALALVAYKKE